MSRMRDDEVLALCQAQMQGALGFLKRDIGRLKNHLLTMEHAITHKVCFLSLGAIWRASRTDALSTTQLVENH